MAIMAAANSLRETTASIWFHTSTRVITWPSSSASGADENDHCGFEGRRGPRQAGQAAQLLVVRGAFGSNHASETTVTSPTKASPCRPRRGVIVFLAPWSQRHAQETPSGG